MRVMKPIVLSLALSLGLMAHPASAEQAPSETETPSEGLSLMEEGAKLFLKGLQSQMEPALEGLEGLAGKVGPALGAFLKEMGPALADIAGKVEDWSVYEAPEMLPNGDIVIRRKPEQTPEAPPETERDGSGATDI